MPATQEIVLVRVRDFTLTPGPRHPHEGKGSGEEFREKHLVPAFEQAEREDKTLAVDLSGTAGYASSFLEEAFGGLARKYGIKRMQNRVEILSEARPWYLSEIEEYIKEAID